jgi:hypothetical protein
MTKELQENFLQTLADMEKLLRTNSSNLSMETLTNAAYYYCKFQTGSDEFWNIIEGQIIKSKDTLSIEQLSKILLSLALAVAINNIPPDLEDYRDLGIAYMELDD